VSDQQRDGLDHNPADDHSCDETNFNSVVEYDTGAVIETHNTAPYVSLGVSRGLTLRYDSLRADARPIVNFGFDDVSDLLDDPPDDPSATPYLTAKLTFRRGDSTIVVPGFHDATGSSPIPEGVHFWRIPSGATSVSAALQGDLADQETGVYQYT